MQGVLLGNQPIELPCGSLNGEFTTVNVIAKSVPLYGDVFSMWAMLGVMICDLKSTGVIFKDDRLMLFAEDETISFQIGVSQSRM